MKEIRWDPAKNENLKTERKVSFDEITVCIRNQRVLTVIQNPSKKYQDQMVLIAQLKRCIYYAPFVEDQESIFLKTIIPSRKFTKKYIIHREGSK